MKLRIHNVESNTKTGRVDVDAWCQNRSICACRGHHTKGARLYGRDASIVIAGGNGGKDV